jgi:hypothetical protein
MKTICAEDLIRSIASDPEINGSNFAKIKRHIDNAPAVGVVHARWEYVGKSSGKLIHRCTNCKSEICGSGDYCKMCGAKMDGD